MSLVHRAYDAALCPRIGSTGASNVEEASQGDFSGPSRVGGHPTCEMYAFPSVPAQVGCCGRPSSSKPVGHWSGAVLWWEQIHTSVHFAPWHGRLPFKCMPSLNFWRVAGQDLVHGKMTERARWCSIRLTSPQMQVVAVKLLYGLGASAPPPAFTELIPPPPVSWQAWAQAAVDRVSSPDNQPLSTDEVR